MVEVGTLTEIRQAFQLGAPVGFEAGFLGDGSQGLEDRGFEVGFGGQWTEFLEFGEGVFGFVELPEGADMIGERLEIFDVFLGGRLGELEGLLLVTKGGVDLGKAFGWRFGCLGEPWLGRFGVASEGEGDGMDFGLGSLDGGHGGQVFDAGGFLALGL